jgi:EmrB/QacA subfamily drug resistance transporter
LKSVTPRVATSGKTDPTSVLVVATLVAFLTPFMTAGIFVAMPHIGHELAADAVSLGWVATSYLLATAILLVPFGRVSDIYGRTRVFIIGLFVFIAGSVLSVISWSILSLIATRVIQGIGSAMIFGTITAILVAAYPPDQRGRVLGINVAAVYLGLSAGPFLGGFLTTYLGWRSIFGLNALLGIAIVPVVLLKMKGEMEEDTGKPFDYAGSIIYALTLLSTMYGLSLLPDRTGAILVVAGLIGLAGFIIWEARSQFPVFDVRFFAANQVFAFSNLAALISYSATASIAFLLSLYLQYQKGMSPSEAGLTLIAQPVMMAALSPLAGRLSDKVEPRLVASAGMGLSALGLGMLAFLSETTGLPYLLVCLVILGVGFALFSSPNTSAIMGAVEKRFYGVASGVLGTMRLVGQMLSLGIVTMFLALYVGRVEMTESNVAQFLPSFMIALRAAFVLFAVLCAAGVVFSLVRGKVRE